VNDDKYTPERNFPTPGQREHSPQRHTAAGTAAPTTTDTGNTVPERANPTQTAYPPPHCYLGGVHAGSLRAAEYALPKFALQSVKL